MGEKESGIVGEVLSNHFDNLTQPVSISLGLFPKGDYRYIDRKKVVDLLRENGIDAVLSTSPEAADITKFVVDETGIRSPLFNPTDAKAAAQEMVDILAKNDVDIMGYAQPCANSSLLKAKMGTNGTFNEIPISDPDFAAKKIAEALTLPEAEFGAKEASLFRGGTLGNQPYGVASSFCRARDFAYATDDIEIAKSFSGANESSWAGRANYKKIDGLAYGFIYEYEKAPDQKFYGNYGIENRKNGGHYETPVFEHRNKLKGVYLNVDGRVVQIAGADGKYLNKDWEKFAEMHTPEICLTDELAIKRNNCLKTAARQGNTVPYVKQKLPLHPVNVSENVAVREMRENAARAAAQFDVKVTARTGGAVVSTAVQQTAKQVNKNKLLARVSAANAKFDKAVDRAVDKGARVLNNSAVGQAYHKAAGKVGETKAAQVMVQGAAKAASTVANTVVGKNVTKVVTKTVGTAVGKSVLKKIPIVSAGAGAYFAWQRIKDGQWKAAGCELLSGVAGCFPGIGTAASVAIDSGLAVNDVNNALRMSQQPEEEKIKVIAEKPKPRGSSKELKAYLPEKQTVAVQDNTAVRTPNIQEGLLVARRKSRGR